LVGSDELNWLTLIKDWKLRESKQTLQKDSKMVVKKYWLSLKLKFLNGVKKYY
jgi:hypothetical protein